MFRKDELGILAAALPSDADGYVPERGDSWRDMSWEEGKEWSDESWATFVEHAVAQTEEVVLKLVTPQSHEGSSCATCTDGACPMSSGMYGP